MASRQLRRLQQAQPQQQEASDGEESGEASPVAQAKPSLFQLLGEEDAASGASDGEVEDAGDEAQESAAPQSAPARPAKAANARKKHKKKAKAKQAEAAAPREGGEDLDQLLAELNINVDAAAAERAQAGASISGATSCLAINPRRLKPEDELRRIFGSKVVAAEARSEDRAAYIPGAGRRLRRLMARGLVQRQQLKPGLLIQPRDHWPRPDGSLSMEFLGESAADGSRTFAFVHSPAYRAASAEFARVQESFDPNALIAFVHHCPSHVGGLLEASELYRGTGQNDAADDLLEQALYTLEMAWHPRCQPAAHGRCRLALDRPENEPQLTALFRYVQMLVRRGLYATALEQAKLLAQLQGGDCLGLMCCIDYIAIKANQLAFLEELVAELDPGGDRYAFQPNLCYSLAMAAFLGAADSQGHAPAEVMQRGARAVMQYPGVVPPLLEWLLGKGVHADAEFQALLRHELFLRSEGGSASLEHLTAIYVERSATLYKDARVLRWLKHCCALATAPEAAPQRANWAVVRRELFPPSAHNAYAHLRLSQFTDDVSRLPDEVVQVMREQQQGAALPELPPEALAQLQQLEEAAEQMPEVRDIAERLRAREHVSDEELQQLNPFIALVRTLLPWVDVGGEEGGAAEQQQQQQQQQEEQEGA